MVNFYNSVVLAQELYQKRMHCSGTLLIQRGAPKSLVDIVKYKRFLRVDMAWCKRRTLSPYVGGT